MTHTVLDRSRAGFQNIMLHWKIRW